jgi:hypothetical protein
MLARVEKFFCIFLFSLFFFWHTTPFTPKSGLIGSVKLCFDALDAIINAHNQAPP